MRTLTIESGKGEKTRSFKAALLGIATCEKMLPSTGQEVKRPVWAVFAGSEREMHAFMANLRGGKKAIVEGQESRFKCVELLKSADYAFAVQREPEGVIVTAYLPEVVRLDPGMVNPTGVGFLMVVPEAWRATQKVEGAADMVRFCKRVGFDMAKEEDVPTALLFAAYLDRRTRAPIVADGAFALQLYYACLRERVASWPSEPGWRRDDPEFGKTGLLWAEGLEESGIAAVVAVVAKHEHIETILAEQVDAYFRCLDGKRRRVLKPETVEACRG